MAAFASCRRAGWVRFLVVLLCALFIFGTVGAPAARAEALTVGLFTAAAVLSAATAALGFKLSNSAEGQATLAKMVQDFRVSATAVGLVLVGSKINGLIDGVDYIKMQVKAGKTYLDERIVAWVQQWLGVNGVYNSFNYDTTKQIYTNNLRFIDLDNGLDVLDSYGFSSRGFVYSRDNMINAIDYYKSQFLDCYNNADYFWLDVSIVNYPLCIQYLVSAFRVRPNLSFSLLSSQKDNYDVLLYTKSDISYTDGVVYYRVSQDGTVEKTVQTGDIIFSGLNSAYYDATDARVVTIDLSSLGVKSNTTGFTGSDTIGKDVVDKSLDETLSGLKEWAPDWWDAGADSTTNGAAAGTKDLPLNLGSDVKTVTGNPAIEVDQPLIYTPWFEQDVGQLRNGETAGTVTDAATSAADSADKAEAAEGTVEDAQGVVQSLISWGLDYISPDKGLFSRFPLCIPYDAYLLATAALGVDAQDIGDIVGQSPGELSTQVGDGVAVQSDFVPVISVKHDWTQDGVTTPLEVTIDLRPYDEAIKMIRTLVSVYVIAELIASEYKRIRGS